MSIFATGPAAALSDSWQALPTKPSFSWISPPQFETIMLRARADGNGTVFNLGEMTATRCSLVLGNGIVGISCIVGRNKRHAAIAAAFDAMMQCQEDSPWQELAREAMLAADEASRKQQVAKASKVRATEVSFSMSIAGRPV